MVAPQDNQKMGIFGIPGTFPTGTVLDSLKKSDPDEKITSWTRAKVNDLYYWYLEGIKQGHKPWTMEDRQIAAFISEHTNLSLSDSNNFGFAIHQLAQAGKIDQKFWMGDSPSTAPSKIISEYLPDPSDLITYAKTIKWVAILGIVGIGLYFTWPMLSAGRKTLKKRMA